MGGACAAHTLGSDPSSPFCLQRAGVPTGPGARRDRPVELCRRGASGGSGARQALSCCREGRVGGRHGDSQGPLALHGYVPAPRTVPAADGWGDGWTNRWMEAGHKATPLGAELAHQTWFLSSSSSPGGGWVGLCLPRAPVGLGCWGLDALSRVQLSSVRDCGGFRSRPGSCIPLSPGSVSGSAKPQVPLGIPLPGVLKSPHLSASDPRGGPQRRPPLPVRSRPGGAGACTPNPRRRFRSFPRLPRSPAVTVPPPTATRCQARDAPTCKLPAPLAYSLPLERGALLPAPPSSSMSTGPWDPPSWPHPTARSPGTHLTPRGHQDSCGAPNPQYPPVPWWPRDSWAPAACDALGPCQESRAHPPSRPHRAPEHKAHQVYLNKNYNLYKTSLNKQSFLKKMLQGIFHWFFIQYNPFVEQK